MPVRISFSALRSNVRVIPAAAIYAQLEAYDRAFCERIIQEVRTYPAWTSPEYTRTYRLYDAWRVVPLSSGAGIRFQVSNRVTAPRRGIYYAQFVHGPNAQVPWHRSHGWKNIADVVNQLGGRDLFRAGAQAIISSAIR